jgi:Flp pilus assembly protein TadD
MSKNREEFTENDRKEMVFLQALSRRCPENQHILKALGDLFTRGGFVTEGLKVDLKLSKLCRKESEVWYNLGCSYALSGDSDAAFTALHTAVSLGYKDTDWLELDDDLTDLREDPRFPVLVRKMKKVGAN